MTQKHGKKKASCFIITPYKHEQVASETALGEEKQLNCEANGALRLMKAD